MRAFPAERWGKIVGSSRFHCLPSCGSGSAFGEGGLKKMARGGWFVSSPSSSWPTPALDLGASLLWAGSRSPWLSLSRDGTGCWGGGVVRQLSDFNLLL